MKLSEDGSLIPVSKDEVERWNTRIKTECARLAKVLIKKNINYNNSVFSPINVFSDLNPMEAVKIRLDDKLKRIMARKTGVVDDEDAFFDLMGYLLCYQVIKTANRNFEAKRDVE